jgi:hypothetical protein
VPFLLGTTAFAQTTPPKTEPAEETGGYTLKGVTAKPVAPQTNAAPYEISGTSFSGSGLTSEVILTQPVGNAAAYKTDSGIYFYPSAFTGFGVNSNLKMSNTNAVSSNFVNIAPELVSEFKYKGDRYTLFANVNSTSYANSSEDDFINSEITLAGDNYFTARARMGWSLGQVNGSDPRGSNGRPVSNEPDRWHSNNLNGRLIYGAKEAQGRIEVDLGTQTKTYDNNRAFTSIADLSRDSIATRLFYRLSGRSLGLAEIRTAQTNYASSLATDTNTERQYYLGYTWEATAATTGIVKLGTMSKDFGLGGKKGFSGSSWEASLRWVPLTYSSWDLQTSRSTADAAGFGDYNLITSTGLGWSHQWTRSLQSRLSAGLLSTEYGGTTRKDNTSNYALTVDYAVMRWLKLGIDISSSDNSSSVSTFEYKRNVTMFTLNASL